MWAVKISETEFQGVLLECFINMIVDIQIRSATLLIGRVLNLILAEDRRMLEKEADNTMGILYHPTFWPHIVVSTSPDHTH